MRLIKYFILTLTYFSFFIFSAQNTFAQGIIQVIVSGVPPVLSSPYVADNERNYHMGQYYILVQYSNPNPAPVSFIFEVALSHKGRELFRITSSPVVYTPGNYMYRTFNDTPAVYFSENPVEMISGRIQEQVLREGILPEGDYILDIVACSADPYVMVTSIPSYTSFDVRFPQPPILISPFDNGNVPLSFPVFSWTPVVGMPMFQFEYEVLIVEVLEGQSPLQAIEANREHAKISTLQPVFIYTHEYLELEQGKQYAWQVRASEVNNLIPISDRGRTEIYTFVASDYIEGFDTDQLQRIPIITDFAELINLERLEITTRTNTITLNGISTLSLDFSGIEAGTFEIEVQCHDLEIITGSLENPVITGGFINGDLRGEILPLNGVGDIVSLEEVEWGLAQGLTVVASIISPSEDILKTEGTLNLSEKGLTGSITATGPSGQPLFEYGEQPVEIAINEITATFPGANLEADVQLKLFNELTTCITPNILFPGELSVFEVSCTVEYTIPLVGNTEMATLYLNTVNGQISIGDENASFDHNLNIASSIRLEVIDGSHFDIPFKLEVSSETGVSADITAPQLNSGFPEIDLGLAAMEIARIEDPWLSYEAETNLWDFGFEFDANLKFSSLDDLQITEIKGILIDSAGIHFPSFIVNAEDLILIQELNISGFGARLTSFTLSEFTFPWFDWDGNLPGPWDIEVDFEFSFPGFPDSMPNCLRNLIISTEEAGFKGGEFYSVIPSTGFSYNECTLELGAGGRLLINRIGGQFTGAVEADEYVIKGILKLDADMVFGAPFDCGDNSAVKLTEGNFFINNEGIIIGEAAGIIPACSLHIDQYQAIITESLLILSDGGTDQIAVFKAKAYIELPLEEGTTTRVYGTIEIDLMTGEFTVIDFETNDKNTSK